MLSDKNYFFFFLNFRYSQWRSLKDSVKSSMHWATPNTSGRMIDLHEQIAKNAPISLNSSPVEEKGEHNTSNEYLYISTYTTYLAMYLKVCPEILICYTTTSEKIRKSSRKFSL